MRIAYSINDLNNEIQLEFEKFLEVAGLAYYETDLDHRTSYSSRMECQILGYKSPEEIKGLKRDTFWYDKKDRALFLKFIQRFGIVVKHPCKYKSKSGGTGWVETTAYKLYKKSSNEEIGIAGIYSEITQRKQREEFIKELWGSIESPDQFYRYLLQGLSKLFNASFASFWFYNSDDRSLNLKCTEGYATNDINITSIYIPVNSKIEKYLHECNCKLIDNNRELIDTLQGKEFSAKNNISHTILIPLFSSGENQRFTNGLIAIYPRDPATDFSIIDINELQLYFSISIRLFSAIRLQLLQKIYSIELMLESKTAENRINYYLDLSLKKILKHLNAKRCNIFFIEKEDNLERIKNVADTIQNMGNRYIESNEIIDKVLKGQSLIFHNPKLFLIKIFGELSSESYDTAMSVPIKASQSNKIIGALNCYGKSLTKQFNDNPSFSVDDIQLLKSIAEWIEPNYEILKFEENKFLSLRKLKHDVMLTMEEAASLSLKIFDEYDKYKNDLSEPKDALEFTFNRVTRMTTSLNKAIDQFRSILPVKKVPKDTILGDLFKSCIYQASYKLRKKGYSIEQIFQEGLYVDTFYVDQSDFRRIFCNLIDNAIKYSEGDKNKFKIEITGKKTNEGFEIKIKDNGIGIDWRDTQNIFLENYRGIRGKGVDGEGLGLFIIKEILDYYEGKIALTSNEKPTEFTIFLPKKFMKESINR